MYFEMSIIFEIYLFKISKISKLSLKKMTVFSLRNCIKNYLSL